MIQTFIFDWSGVISDDTKPVYEANMMLLEDYGKARIGFEEWRESSSFSPAGFLRNCGISADEKETYETYKKYFQRLVNNGMHPEMIQGVDAVLSRLFLMKRTLAVMSAHPCANLHTEARKYGIDDKFACIVGSTLDKAAGLRELRARFGFDGDGIYVGDTIYDVQAAKAAGVKMCAVTTGYHSRKRLKAENPDFIIDSLEGLVGLCE